MRVAPGCLYFSLLAACISGSWLRTSTTPAAGCLQLHVLAACIFGLRLHVTTAPCCMQLQLMTACNSCS